MQIHEEDTISQGAVEFLKRCYIFVSREWQHAQRELLPDQGFEKRFRESCIVNLNGWRISQEREMHLGYGLDTASGIAHEVDIVAQNTYVTAILEMKNRQSDLPNKNDVVVFFAKVFDYLALNPVLLLKDVCLAFISNTTFELSGLAACLGLGIHPISPALRPLPILTYNAKLMNYELRQGLSLPAQVQEEFQDFCANLNRMSLVLSNTWLPARCGYQSEDRLIMKANGGLPTLALAQEFMQLNSDCTQLLKEFKQVKERNKS